MLLNMISIFYRRLKSLSLKYLLVAEVFFFLALMRFAVLFIPFRYLNRCIGRPQSESPFSENSAAQLKKLRTIRFYIEKAARIAPWDCKCLVKAAAGVIMLRRRGLLSTLYLGVAKNKENRLSAHAWLRCGNFYVCGFENANEFTVITTFSHAKNI